MSKLWRLTFLFLFLSVMLVGAAIIYSPDNNLHMVFCDVGQGDGILIYQKDKQVVVDGGPNDAILSCMSRYLPFWERSIELVILTNPDTDHYTGLVGVLKNYKVENYIAPQLSKDDASFKQLAAEIEKESRSGMRVHYGFAGQKVALASQGTTLRGWEMEEVWPTREFFVGETKTNELSLVYLLKFGNFKALLTGDIEPPASDVVAELLPSVILNDSEGSLANASYLNKSRDSSAVPRNDNGITVLKVPHHGSKNGLTEELLRAVNPHLAVISAGRNNRFGHPSPEILNMLKGVQILRTDQKGDIEVVTDGKKWWVR